MSSSDKSPHIQRVVSAFEIFIGDQRAEADPARFVAYAIYKSLKREWETGKREALGRDPNPAELAEYRATLTPGRIRQIQDDATDVLAIFAAEAVKSQTAKIVKEHLGTPMFGSTYREGVAAGVTAAFLWSLILVAIGIVFSLFGSDVFGAIELIWRRIHPG